MRILVSACLMGENCKYNGGNNYCEKLMKFVAGHEVFSVCPEVMGGLPTPRLSCEIVNGEVINEDGISCDKQFREGADTALEIAKRENVSLAILKSGSPSCGIGKIYDGTFTGKLCEGDGVFAALLKKNGIKVLDVGEL